MTLTARKEKAGHPLQRVPAVDSNPISAGEDTVMTMVQSAPDTVEMQDWHRELRERAHALMTELNGGTFPEVPLPDWATSDNGWDVDFHTTERTVRHSMRWPEGAGLDIEAHQYFGPDGLRTDDEVIVTFDLGDGDFDDVADLRQLAAWTTMAADAMEAINAAGAEAMKPGGFTTIVGRGVLRLRAQRDVRHMELAVASGLNAEEITSITQGRSTCDLDALARMARALGVKPVDVIEAGLSDEPGVRL